MNILRVAAAIGWLMVLSSASSAGLVVNLLGSVEGHTEDYQSAVNDVLGNQPGFYAAQIGTDETGAEDLKFEFVGSEAGWSNWLTITNGFKTAHISNHPNGKKGVVNAGRRNKQEVWMDFAAEDLLDFTFDVDRNKDHIADKSVSNGNNLLPGDFEPSNGDTPNFWMGFEYANTGDIIALLLALDDGGGSIDSDHDDLVVRISNFDNVTFTATEVPLPAALPLFSLGLVGLGLLKRRAR